MSIPQMPEKASVFGCLGLPEQGTYAIIRNETRAVQLKRDNLFDAAVHHRSYIWFDEPLTLPCLFSRLTELCIGDLIRNLSDNSNGGPYCKQRNSVPASQSFLKIPRRVNII